MIHSDNQNLLLNDKTILHDHFLNQEALETWNRLERAIQKSEERYRALIEQASDGIFTTDLEGNFLDVNGAGCTLFKCSREEILKRRIKDFILDEDFPVVAEGLKTLRKGGTLLGEKRIKCRDGSVILTEVSAKMISDGRIQAFVRDITFRKKMEEELLNVKKLESIGVLAGGIAHDFNNLLTAILGNISLALVSIPKKTHPFERLTAAEKACFRAKELTQQLLTFSTKGGAPVKKTASIADIIRESACFAARGAHLLCDFKFSPRLWAVEVDEGQISQVINNLIINAIQASPSGGRIEITAENITSKSEDQIVLKPGKYIKVMIRDHGKGIPEDHLPRIFEPYFTTKRDGNGLGLATSYSIIKKHGGEITVHSKCNSGTLFSIYLPALGKRYNAPQKEKTLLKKGKGRILVMDDEALIREVTPQMLNKLGYESEVARNGSEAIRLYQKAMKIKQPFEAVIIDLTIPGGTGGKETIERLTKIDPSIKAIISSGYSNDPVMINCQGHQFQTSLSKPYKLHDLGKVLHQLLNESPVEKLTGLTV